jgi:hypothetical protein
LTVTNKKRVSYLIKACILVLAFWFIYYEYSKKKNHGLRDFETLLGQIGHTQVIISLTAVVLLMVVNWVLESLKWRYATRKIVTISPWVAIESVFCGLTWAIFTPNRLGEYGGRVMFLPNRKRILGVFAMAVAGFGQNLLTNVLGVSGVVWFCYRFFHLNALLLTGITAGAVCIISFFIIFYFNIKWLVWLLDKVSFLKKYHRFFEILGRYKTDELLKLLAFSISRFFVFTLQYYIIMHMLIPQMAAFDMVMMLFVFFFIQSAVPSLDLLDIGVRSLTASTLFNYVTGQHIAIIASVSFIYVVNLIVPALIGTIFVFKLKFFDRTA